MNNALNSEDDTDIDVNKADNTQEDIDDETGKTGENEESDENTEKAETSDEAPKKDKKDLLIEELNDKYMRTFAEFDNFRKRTEKEKAAMFEVGAKSIVEKILPIVDSFERGLATVSEEQKEEPFVSGMDKVYKQLMTTLEEAGVKPIEALNQEFNPDFHNAVMHIEDENIGENIVVEEFQKGYMYRENVVRHSMVKVAN
ncbi:MAG: nucleotide exchange factor GrpE [Lachnospiraceae bacterium]|nr:nucleotide exchange factor GrpE [Lachnospiraceae bacterium]